VVRARLTGADDPDAERLQVMGLPVLHLPSSSTHAVTNTSEEAQTAFRSHSPVTTAFPALTPDRLPHHPF
jgi:hypothetical protein